MHETPTEVMVSQKEEEEGASDVKVCFDNVYTTPPNACSYLAPLLTGVDKKLWRES